MTVRHYILLVAIAFSPLPLCAQNLLVPPNAVIDGPRYGFPPDQTASPPDVRQPFQPAAGIPNNAASGRVIPVQPGTAPAFPRSRTTQRYSQPVWETSRKGSYYGIMGAVQQPGVYFQTEDHVKLGDLLKRAGGATNQASGGVRIVRQGRGGLQTFLSADSPYELMNGDVVLLESNRFGSQTKSFYPRVGDQTKSSDRGTGTNQGGAATSPSQAWLAFVNLTDQPVIVPVPAEQATLTSVLKWLRQDADNPPQYRILSPNPVLRLNAGQSAENQLLESGTVLVFNPATVLRDRLPEFPPVLGAKPDEKSGTVPNTSATGQPAARTGDAKSDPAPVARPSATDKPEPHIVPQEKGTKAPSRSSAQFDATRDTHPIPANVHPTGVEQTRSATHGSISSQRGNPNPRNESHTGGPLLMMPQLPGSRRQGNAASDSNLGQPPLELDEDAARDASAASHEGLPMSWQQSASDPGNGSEVEPAWGNRQQAGFQDEFGPALELPRPAPQLVPPDITATSNPVPTVVPQPVSESRFVNLSSPVIWFCLGALVLLAGGIWWLARWERPRRRNVPSLGGPTKLTRPVAMNTKTGVNLASEPTDPATVPDGSVPQLAPRSPSLQSTLTGQFDTVLPPQPQRTISHQEQVLRDHFHAARLLKTAQRVADSITSQLPTETRLTSSPDSPPSTSSSDEMPLSAQVPLLKIPTATNPRSAPQDLLDRALQATQRRNRAA